MLDPIVNFFTRIFQWIGRGIGLVIGIILWPFLWVGRWYTQRGLILKAVLGGGARVWSASTAISSGTRRLDQFQSRLCASLYIRARRAGRRASRRRRRGRRRPRPAPGRPLSTVTADLIDFNVNQNAWISSMMLYKLGFFGVDWDHTPFLDNKASFQRGITSGAPHGGRTGRYDRPRSRHQPDRSEPAGGTRRCRVRRGNLVFRPQPVRTKDAEAQLLPYGHHVFAHFQRPTVEMQRGIQCPRRQSRPVHRPYCQ